jgi:hypothetical protein
MKILYLSAHSILEYDEVKLLHELGHQVFSPGAYVEPANPGDASLRPSISGLVYDPEILRQYHLLGAAFPGQDGKDHLSKSFVDNFDVVVVMHMPRWIENNWEAMKHKKVIWRTIGQSVASVEQNMKKYVDQGLVVLRYSPNEANIPHFCGQHGLIRFGKDPEVYKGWTGEKQFVINFTQSMQQRGTACGYKIFDEVTKIFPRKLFGPENNQPGFGMGKVSFEQQVEELQKNRCYFYTGTHPASYTLNYIEAAMTGIPVVAIGPQNGNAEYWRNHNLYEVHNLIQDGVNGFVSDDPNILRKRVRDLLADKALADRVSEAGRKEAIKHFGVDMIRAAWGDFLKRVVG